MGWIRFNGKSSTDFSTEVFIQKKPDYEFPEKDVEFISIPGRSGDLVIDHNRYKNVEKTYYIASVVHGYNEENQNGNNFIKQAALLVKWLKNTKGYGILEDSYDKNVYRKAIYVEESIINDIYDGAAALELIFNCKPQRYFTWGNLPWSISDYSAYHGILYVYPRENPSDSTSSYHSEVLEDSKPLIYIKLITKSAGSDNYGKLSFTISNLSSITLRLDLIDQQLISGKTLVFDSDALMLYEESQGTNYTQLVEISGKDPMMYLIDDGNNVMATKFDFIASDGEEELDDVVNEIRILPRWWKL